jgi:diphthamide synthase (EF-2-diphthine--ammonia ligase)
MAGSGIAPIFPLWGMPTDRLSRKMVRSGLRAMITCVDPKRLPEDFAGQEYGESFLGRIPAHIDPCGENGEFHTFAFAGPMFRKPVGTMIGETVKRDGFLFTDLLPMRIELNDRRGREEKK